MTPDRSQFRDRARYAAALASEALAPALRVYARTRAPGTPTPPERWRRGLVIGSGHIGDVLYRTCSLDPLARALPGCEWSYLTTRQGAEILRGNPAVRHILPLMESGSADSVTRTGINELRSREFDAILCTDSVGHLRPLRLALHLGIANRVAFVSKGFSGLATFPVRTTRKPWAAQIRDMVNAVTGTIDPSALRPEIYLDAADYDLAAAERQQLPFTDASLTVVVAPTTRQAAGAAPAAFFARVLRAALELEPDARFVVSGASTDVPALQAVAGEVGPRAVVRAGTLPLRAYAAFVACADALFGLDSGPRHIANAVHVPAIFVRNMAVPEIETGVYCVGEIDVAPPGQYMSGTDISRLLARMDHHAVAASIISAARCHALPGRAVTARWPR